MSLSDKKHIFINKKKYYEKNSKTYRIRFGSYC